MPFSNVPTDGLYAAQPTSTLMLVDLSKLEKCMFIEIENKLYFSTLVNTFDNCNDNDLVFCSSHRTYILHTYIKCIKGYMPEKYMQHNEMQTHALCTYFAYIYHTYMCRKNVCEIL